MDNRTTDKSPWEVYMTKVFPIQAELLELVALPFGNQEGRGVGVSGIQTYTMGIIEMRITRAATAKNLFQTSLGIISQDVLCTISIRNIDVSGRANCCFGRYKLIRSRIFSAFLWPGDFQQDFAVEGSFKNGMAVVIADPEEFFPIFVAQCQAVGTWELVAPGTKAFPGSAVYNNVVTSFVSKQKQSSLLVNDHFVAIIDWHFCRVEVAPGRVWFVLKPTMADYILAERICEAFAGHQSGTAGAEGKKEGSALHEKQVEGFRYIRQTLDSFFFDDNGRG